MRNSHMVTHLVRIIALALIMLLLTGCGFHLQGQMKLAPPLQRLYLQTPDPYGQLARNLQDYLKMSNVELVDKRENASAILSILRDETSQVMLSVSGTEQTRQYRLNVILVFEVLDAQNRVIIPPEHLIESRTITIQSNQILGSSNETNLFYQQMRRTLARSLMYRLSSQGITAKVNAAFQSNAAVGTTT